MAASSGLPSDEMLLQDLWIRFRGGDGEAFDDLVRRRYRTLFNYATRFTKDREFIKDCVQDLFLELWDKRANLMPTPYVTIYLIRSLRNNLIRKLKLEKRLNLAEDGMESFPEFTDGSTIENDWIHTEMLYENEKNMRRAIDRLPKRQQEVIFLKFYEGLSNEEIAGIMEIERQTVASFTHRALIQLKALMPTLTKALLPWLLLFGL